MNAQQIQIVKESWSYVIVKSDEAGETFYSRLFEVAPGVRYLFKSDPKDQARKLMSMITYVIAKLDKLDTIIDEVKSLAVRHNKYGAQKEHYAVVGECLIYTLKKGLGPKWNSETQAAWLEVYTVLATAMITAQEKSAKPVTAL